METRSVEGNSRDVLSAFEILLEEIEAEIEFVNGVGAKGFETSDYEKAREALERAGRLSSFRDKVVTLRSEWQGLMALAGAQEDEETRLARRKLGRLRRGLRTTESDYYRPILETLVAMGGSGRVGEVLDRVFVEMKPVLRDVDLEPLTSDPDNPRWRNAAQWARNSMVNEGLLKKDSPRGVWEISEAGRAYLNPA
jgi:hypothetical protein